MAIPYQAMPLFIGVEILPMLPLIAVPLPATATRLVMGSLALVFAW
jgi:hypothetical protein